MMDEFQTKGEQARAYAKANPTANANKFHADTGLAKAWWYHVYPKSTRVGIRPKLTTNTVRRSPDGLMAAKHKELLEAPEHAAARVARKQHVDGLTTEQMQELARVVAVQNSPMSKALGEYVSLYPDNDIEQARAFFGYNFARSTFYAERKPVLDAMCIAPARKRYAKSFKQRVKEHAKSTGLLDAAILEAANSFDEKPAQVVYGPGPVLQDLMLNAVKEAAAGVTAVADRAIASQKKQVGGDHYTKHAIQPWDAIEQWVQSTGFEAYLHGNIIKYVARYPSKGGVEDLRKAAHYIERLIEHLEGGK